MSAPPDVQALGGAVLVQGPTLAELDGLLRRGLRDRARDGYRPSSRSVALLEAVELAVRAGRVSPSGRGDVPLPADPSPLPVDRITTAGAAGLLGLSSRQVRRKREELGGVYHAGVLLFDAATVAAVAVERGRQHGE